MTQKEKAEKLFLEFPIRLSLKKIENFLLSKWFEIKSNNWSHRKIFHKEKNIIYIYPVHNWDTKDIYKKYLSRIYKNINN